jgi:thioredoxin-related protein
MMTREVYTDKRFIEFSRSQVFLRVFEDTQPEGERLARKFGVPGFPTLIILDFRGHEVDRIVGARRAQDLIEELHLIFNGAKGNRISI